MILTKSHRTEAAVALCVALGIAAVVAAAPVRSADAQFPVRPSPPAPEPAAAPPRLNGEIELELVTRDDLSFPELLSRAGVNRTDAAEAAKLIAETTTIPAGKPLRLHLGKRAGSDRALAGLTLRPRLGLTLLVVRDPHGPLRLTSTTEPIDASPRRFRGSAGTGLFWALRAAGVPAEAARDYLAAVQPRLAGRAVGQGDRFDLIIDHRRSAGGEKEWGQLLYAGLDRSSGADIRLVRWTMHGGSEWAEPGANLQRRDGLVTPVSGRTTSNFGYRLHPISGRGRFHRGVDIGAPTGTPVVAASDGIVTAAGWNGGYGRQVQLAHDGGLATSYSHLSSIVAAPGSRVARGQLIGFVGSSGLSTGPHLHFEAFRGGVAVDPMALRETHAFLSPTDIAAVNARLRQLLG